MNPIKGIQKEGDVRNYLLHRGIAAMQRRAGFIAPHEVELVERYRLIDAPPLPILYDLLWIHQVNQLMPEVNSQIVIGTWACLVDYLAGYATRISTHNKARAETMKTLYQASLLMGLVSFQDRMTWDSLSAFRDKVYSMYPAYSTGVLIRLISGHFGANNQSPQKTPHSTLLQNVFELLMYGNIKTLSERERTRTPIDESRYHYILDEVERFTETVVTSSELLYFVHRHYMNAFWPIDKPEYLTKDYLR